MILYLAKAYLFIFFAIGLVVSLVPVLFGNMPIIKIIPRTLFISGLGAGAIVYWYFKQRNLWPLYDNLRIPKYLILGACILSTQILNAVFILCLLNWQHD